MVVYLSCEYFNSKHFKHVFISKNAIIHIDLYTVCIFKNTTYNIQQAIFSQFYFALQIHFHKFSGSNSTLNSTFDTREWQE